MTREELKEHCEKQIEMCEMWAISKGEKPSGKIYEEHKLILELLEQEPILDKIRAEIESKREEVSNKNSENNELQAFFHGLNDGLKDARDIIEKYKTGGSCK